MQESTIIVVLSFRAGTLILPRLDLHLHTTTTPSGDEYGGASESKVTPIISNSITIYNFYISPVVEATRIPPLK